MNRNTTMYLSIVIIFVAVIVTLVSSTAGFSGFGCTENETPLTLFPGNPLGQRFQEKLDICLINGKAVNATGPMEPCPTHGYECSRLEVRTYLWRPIALRIVNTCYYGCIKLM